MIVSVLCLQDQTFDVVMYQKAQQKLVEARADASGANPPDLIGAAADMGTSNADKQWVI